MSVSAAALRHQILLVEDNRDDVLFMRRALKQSALGYAMQVVVDGQQAVDYLAGAGKFKNRDEYPMPSIIFLDLKLPFLSGFDVLAWIRRHPNLKDIPVVILTSSPEQRDQDRARQLAAQAYLIKPPTDETLLKAVAGRFDSESVNAAFPHS